MDNYNIQLPFNKPQLREKDVKLREDLFSFKNLYKAYLGCRKLKRTTYHAARNEKLSNDKMTKIIKSSRWEITTGGKLHGHRRQQ
jgi:hypothetical protein